MSLPLPTCDAEGCTGHLGKFSSCVTEALYETTLDDGRGTGNVDFEGWMSDPIEVTPDEPAFVIDPDGEDRHVIVPAGWYLVTASSQGFVDHARYDTEAEARAVFDEHDARYAEWDADGIDDALSVSTSGWDSPDLPEWAGSWDDV